MVDIPKRTKNVISTTIWVWTMGTKKNAIFPIEIHFNCLNILWKTKQKSKSWKQVIKYECVYICNSRKLAEYFWNSRSEAKTINSIHVNSSVNIPMQRKFLFSTTLILCRDKWFFNWNNLKFSVQLCIMYVCVCASNLIWFQLWKSWFDKIIDVCLMNLWFTMCIQ